jgi:GNAT superfamily N-acetyltransferase
MGSPLLFNRRPMFTNDDLLTLADLNLAEANREHARWLSPFLIEERDGLLFTAAGTRFPTAPFNVAKRIGGTRIEAPELLDRARAFFSANNRGFSIQASGHIDQDIIALCEREGFLNVSGRLPGMVCTERLAPASLASHVTCRAIDAASAADFVQVSALSYEPTGLPPAVCQKVLSQSTRWLAPHWHVRVIYDHDEPVSAAMLLFSHGIAGVYWVGTTPSARGKGYAAAIMREITNHAFDHGARAVILQASRMGEPVYARLGYREITTYPWYLVPNAT